MPIYIVSGKKILFIHIPKTGGTSISNMLSNISLAGIDNDKSINPKSVGLPCNPRHFHNEINNLLYPENYFFLKFAVVRNPIDRLVSEYFYRKQVYLSKGKKIADINIWIKHAFACYKANFFYLDNHIRPQSEFILPGTKVFKYEDGLEEPIKYIQKNFPKRNFKFPNRIPVLNKASRDHMNLDEETLDLVRKFYKIDFDNFYL